MGGLPDPVAWDCRRLLARAQAEGRLPSVAASVVRRGAVLWHAGIGDCGGGEPGPDTQYRIGSITKTFTAVLVLQLRDEGLLDLADPLERHVPGTPLGAATVRGLLAHLAGLGREPAGPWWERSPGRPWPELAGSLSSEALVLPAGHTWHYSNLGYGLLGELVARLRGAPWAEVLRDRLLAPLGLHRTTYDPEPPSATGFSVHPWADTVAPEPAPDTGAMAAAGQLWSTTADLGRWAAFLAEPDEGVLAPETLAEMAVPVPLSAGGGGDGYGLGLMQWHRGGRLLVGHGGSMPGFRACLAVDRSSGVGAVVLSNATHGYDVQRLAADLVDVACDGDRVPAGPWRPGRPPPPEVAALLGSWFWGYVEMLVTWRADRLRLASPTRPWPEAGFEPVGTDTWRGLDAGHEGELLRVVRRPDGTVDHLDLSTYVLTRGPRP